MKRALLCWLAAGLPAFAGLVFDEPVKEVNADVEAQSITLEFPFKNTGDSPVKIDHYGGCTCATMSLKGGKMAYLPGEAGLMQVVFDLSSFSGRVHQQLGVWLAGAPETKPSNMLDVHINIPVLIEIEPRTVIWDVGAIAEPKTVIITVKGSDPIHLTNVSEGLGKFTRELKTIEDGRKYELTLSPQSTEHMDFLPFRIETDSPSKRYKVQQVFATVRKPGVGVVTPGVDPSNGLATPVPAPEKPKKGFRRDLNPGGQ